MLNQEEHKQTLIQTLPLPKELADQLDSMHYEWAYNAFKNGETIESIIEKAIVIEAEL
jgi:hypothetical protein